MTAPDSIVVPQPSWWVRSGRIGVNLNATFGWSEAAAGPHQGLSATSIYKWVSDAAGIKTPQILTEIVAEMETSTAVLNLRPATLHGVVGENERATLVLNRHRIASATSPLVEVVAPTVTRTRRMSSTRSINAAVSATLTSVTPVTLKGVNTADATSVTIPAHSIGDIIVIYAMAGSNSIPGKPTASGTVPAWVDIDANAGANSIASRAAYFVATATTTTSGTWSLAGGVAAAVLSGIGASPIGGHAESGGVATGNAGTVAPSITMSHTDGSSALLHFFCQNFLATNQWNAAPTGYTKQASGVHICCDTKNVTSSDGSVTQTYTSTSSQGYRGATVEIVSH